MSFQSFDVKTAKSAPSSEWWEKESLADKSLSRNFHQFRPSRLIVLSELPTKKKEYYYNLLLKQRAKLAPDGNGNYVANIRLLGPDVKKSDIPQVTKRDYRRFIRSFISNLLNQINTHLW
jgi:hypothetical protein